MSLQIWLPLSGSLENKGLSQSHVIANNATTLTTINGKVTPGYASFASGNYITISDAANIIDINNKQMSFAFWMKTTATHNMCLFCNRSTTGNGISIFKLDQTTFRFDTNNDGQTKFTCAATYPNWTHFCFTWDGQYKKLYINGVETQSLPCAATVTNYNTKAWIGTSAANTMSGTSLGNHFVGSLNDYRIYNHCLSPREVKLLAQGLIAHYKLEAPHLENTTNIDPWRSAITNQILPDAGDTGIATVTYGSYYNYPSFKIVLSKNNITSWQGFYHSATPTSYGASVGDVVTRSYWMYVPQDQKNNMPFPGGQYLEGSGEIISQTKYNLDLCDTWQRISITAKVGGTNCNLLNYLVSQSSGNINFTCYIRDFQMEIKDHPTLYTSTSREDATNLIEYDSSGYNNHGTCSAVFKHTSDAPRYKNCKNFENNKYINCGRGAMVTDALTISCWTQANNWSTFDGQLISCTDTGGWGLGYGANKDGHGFEVFCNNDYHGINLNYNSLSSGWHHIAATYNGNTIIGYIDGQPIASKSGLPGKLTYNSSNCLMIGAEPGGTTPSGNYFTGKISDVRIYATALSAAAVKELYQSSISFLDNGTLQCSEIVESPTNLKYNQNGITQAELISEIGYTNKMKVKEVDGKIWARIYWLNLQTDKTCFQSEVEVLECTNAPNRFSLMKYVDKFKSKEGKYEFMLTYPLLSATGYNGWTQTGSPNVNYGTNVGYVKGHTDFPHDSYVGPLTYTHSDHRASSMYSANKSANWWSPVGQKALYSNGIPASNGATTYETELWVRIDNLPKLTKLSMLDDAIQAFQIYEL